MKAPKSVFASPVSPQALGKALAPCLAVEAPRLNLGLRAVRRAKLHLARHMGASGPWRACFARTMQSASSLGPWPVRALLVDASLALGLSSAATSGLLAAAFLWHVAADALDDAMDGDSLPGQGPPHAPWARSATMALSCMQLAPKLACASMAAPCRLAAYQAFTRSGRVMALGQDRDLRLAQAWAKGPDAVQAWPGLRAEAAWAEAAKGKTGGAMALYATLPALAAGAPQAWLDALWALGTALGLAWQLASDMDDPPGSGQSPGLMQLWALAAFQDPEERDLAWGAWELKPGAPPWAMVCDWSGAGAFAQARLVQAWAEAEALALALPALSVPPALSAAALAWVEEGRAATLGLARCRPMALGI